MNPAIEGWHSLVAVLPIVVLVWLMVVRSWGAARAGPVALLVAGVIALAFFGADPRILALSQAKGALLSIWVLSIIWAALLLYHLVDETGRLPQIGRWLARLTPSRPLQVLLLAWAFTSFLQGIAGYGVPVAVVAPLMVANGFTPAVAVITTSIGHSWSVTFGSLAASYFALAGVTGAGGSLLAADSAIMLGAACVLCGSGAVWAFGGGRALASVALPLLFVALLMSAVQFGLAIAGAESVSAFAAGAVGVAALMIWGRLRRGAESASAVGDSEKVTVVDFFKSFAAYVALIVIVLANSFIEPLADAMDAVSVRLPFPATDTALGWVNGATDSYRTLSPFGDTGPLLVYAALLGFWFYRRTGMVTPGALKRAAKRTVSSAVSSSIGIVTMVGMALAMTDSGMTYALASGMATVAGALFPVVAPFIGVLGAFMTGSNTNSNILFGALQQDTARLLGLSTTVILAAQTAGGAIGSMLAPAKLVVGCSTVGLGGQEGPILKVGVRYGLAIALVIGLIATLWVRLA